MAFIAADRIPAERPLRVVLTGSECSGKSTMAKALSEHFNVPFVHEELREVFVEKKGILTLDDALIVAQRQLESETKCEVRSPNMLITDTNILSSCVYTHHYYADQEGSAGMQEFDTWANQVLQHHAYDHYFLCGIDTPWENDGQRDQPHAREELHHKFVEALKHLNAPYTILNGEHNKRVSKAIAVVQKLWLNHM
ncbi:MAG: NadR-like protein [Hyphomicrobiales bacterium]|nr:MAG: NadR-like protein [Hyphomicrobiales bacterium]